MAGPALRVLGFDLGTTALKAVVSDGRARIFASTSVPLATRRPRPGWSEQAPDDWWTAARTAARQLAAAAPADWARIAAISFSGQMHGVVLLRDGRPLRPCLLWNDGRAVAEAHHLNSLDPAFAMLAGVRAMAGFAAPKLLWLKRHEAETLARADTVLAPKDYLRLRMTGEAATDPVDASGFWLMDVAARRWSAPLVEAAGLAPAQLPQIREANAPAGHLTAKAAKALGLKSGLPVVTGTGDAAANTLGLGLTGEGDGVLSMGTSAQIFVTRNAHHPAPQDNIHAFAHAMPQRWFQMAALLNGASPLQWLMQRLGTTDYQSSLRQAARRGPPVPPLMFLPYLAGERTPLDDPHMRGAFLGLDHAHDSTDLLYAVLDGVALSLADCAECLAKAGGLPPHLYAVGGGFRSSLWARMIASAVGLPLHVTKAGDFGGAMGAARLALSGLTGEADAAIFRKPRHTTIITPDSALAKSYAARLPAFRAAAAALAPIR
jgi:xylulokinase